MCARKPPRVSCTKIHEALIHRKIGSSRSSSKCCTKASMFPSRLSEIGWKAHFQPSRRRWLIKLRSSNFFYIIFTIVQKVLFSENLFASPECTEQRDKECIRINIFMTFYKANTRDHSPLWMVYNLMRMIKKNGWPFTFQAGSRSRWDGCKRKSYPSPGKGNMAITDDVIWHNSKRNDYRWVFFFLFEILANIK